MKLVDFQIVIRRNNLPLENLKKINFKLFAYYEPIRLWLKKNAIHVPFRKVVISITDKAVFSKWDGNITIVADICEVTVCKDISVIHQVADNATEVYQMICDVVKQIENEVNIPLDKLTDFVSEQSKKQFPVIYFFDDQSREHNGYKFIPWISMQPGITEIGVIIRSSGIEKNIIALRKNGPVFLEDDFPMHKTMIKNGEFNILRKDNSVLFHVAIEDIEKEALLGD